VQRQHLINGEVIHLEVVGEVHGGVLAVEAGRRSGGTTSHGVAGLVEVDEALYVRWDLIDRTCRIEGHR